MGKKNAHDSQRKQHLKVFAENTNDNHKHFAQCHPKLMHVVFAVEAVVEQSKTNAGIDLVQFVAKLVQGKQRAQRQSHDVQKHAWNSNQTNPHPMGIIGAQCFWVNNKHASNVFNVFALPQTNHFSGNGRKNQIEQQYNRARHHWSYFIGRHVPTANIFPKKHGENHEQGGHEGIHQGCCILDVRDWNRRFQRALNVDKLFSCGRDQTHYAK